MPHHQQNLISRETQSGPQIEIAFCFQYVSYSVRLVRLSTDRLTPHLIGPAHQQTNLRLRLLLVLEV